MFQKQNAGNTMESKSVFSSMTVWVNSLVLITTVGDEFAAVFPPEVAKYVLMVVAIANIILRVFKTSQPVDLVSSSKR